MFHRLSGILLFCGKEIGDFRHISLFHPVILKSPETTEYGYPHTAFIVDCSHDLDQPYAASLLHMGRAAGTAVISRDLYDPYLAFNFYLAPVCNVL